MNGKRKDENEINQLNGKVKHAKTSSNSSTNILTIDGSLDISFSKNISKGKWISEKSCVEIVVMKGNFWRVMGFTSQSKNYLYPEEALYLYEKNMLIIVKEREEIEGEGEGQEDEVIYQKDMIYEMIIKVISLQCYLCYSKLKMMDYIVTRYHQQKPIVNITETLLHHLSEEKDQLFSFSAYGNTSTWSKKTCLQSPPAAYVVVTDSEFSFPATMTLSFLSKAKGVPVLFAIVTDTGHVYIEEFTDALLTLDWNLPVGTPNGASAPHSFQQSSLQQGTDQSTDSQTLDPPVDVAAERDSRDTLVRL